MFSGATAPGMTNSSPVENKATRGFRVTSSWAKPMLAAKPKPAGSSRVPFCITTEPRVTSSPLRRIHCPNAGAELTTMTGTSACAFSVEATCVSSCMTTALAPGGMGAPVKMRAASPEFKAWPCWPAGIRCVTFKLAPTCVTSSTRTA